MSGLVIYLPGVGEQVWRGMNRDTDKKEMALNQPRGERVRAQAAPGLCEASSMCVCSGRKTVPVHFQPDMD